MVNPLPDTPCQHTTITVADETTVQETELTIPAQCAEFPAGLAIYYDFTLEIYHDGETSGTPPPFIFVPCQQTTLIWEECETPT